MSKVSYDNATKSVFKIFRVGVEKSGPRLSGTRLYEH